MLLYKNACLKNRISTTEVSDALGKTGLFPKVLPVNHGKFCVGNIRCVFTAHNSNYAVHEQIKHVQPGDIVFIFSHDCDDRAIIGDIISKFTLLYKQAAAIVVQGKVRDIARLHREDYSIWSDGMTPIGCFNTPSKPFPLELEKQIRNDFDGGIAIADDGGVVIISPNQISKKTLDRLKIIELQESIWYYCLDVLKWDTQKIVCDKKYLDGSSEMSSTQSKVIKVLKTPLDKK